MNQILEIDEANLRAVVQPGVVNLDFSRAVDISACISLPILRARNRAQSAEMSPKTQVGRTPWPTV